MASSPSSAEPLPDPVISVVQDGTDPRLETLLPFFEELHAVMCSFGMLMPLAPNGARIWLDGVRPGLERFGRLVIAESEGRIVGFTYGAVKLAPEHLGGGRVGQWSHLFVEKAFRRHGTSRRMSEVLHEWFAAKGITNIETQVVQHHPSSVDFARSFGYQVELIQMRKLE